MNNQGHPNCICCQKAINVKITLQDDPSFRPMKVRRKKSPCVCLCLKRPMSTPILTTITVVFFIDDIMFLWQHGDTELQKFKDHLNNCHSTIEFTFESS